MHFDLPPITDATITEAEAAELVPADDMLWRRVAKDAKTHTEAKRRNAAEYTAVTLTKDVRNRDKARKEVE